jgi:choline dehydrogenase-like flavoprotein
MSSSNSNSAEVIIVGAGAAGAYMAARLAEAGKAVMVLDAGPAWSMDDLVSNQIWAKRLRWGGVAPDSAGSHPYPFAFNSGWGVGGAALHHYGTWPRMHEADFETHSRFGRGMDWPLKYSDLRPYYDRVQGEVGISGDAEVEIWRPPGDPYPLPPLTLFEQARLIQRGFDALDIPTAPAPLAILSENYHGRPACIYDGWCDAGCPTGALYNPLVSDIPRARAAGADIRSRATVTRILNNGDRATGVEYGGVHGKRVAVEGNLIVLAASVVQNAALLLKSAGDTGLANGSGLVGKYFMSHAASQVYGMFVEETANYKGVTGAQLISHAGYGKDRDNGLFGSYQWLIAPAMKPNALLGVALSRVDLFGGALHAFMHQAARGLGNMLFMAEELPEVENRIELAPQTDIAGMHRTRIVHSYSENTLALAELAKQEGLRIMRAAGAKDVWAGALAQAHMMGGTIMGDDPARSVTDSYGRSHDVHNLVLAGSGLFPTGAAVNPTFTIYALAARTVDHMLMHWSDYSG